MVTVPAEKEVEWVSGIHSEGGQCSWACVPAPRWDPVQQYLSLSRCPLWIYAGWTILALQAPLPPTPVLTLSWCSLALLWPSPLPLLSTSCTCCSLALPNSPPRIPNPLPSTYHHPPLALFFPWTVKNLVWPQVYGKRWPPASL